MTATKTRLQAHQDVLLASGLPEGSVAFENAVRTLIDVARREAFEEAIAECGGESEPKPGANAVEFGFWSLAKRIRALATKVSQ